MTQNNLSLHSFKSLFLTILMIAGSISFDSSAQDSYAEYVKQYLSGLRKFKNERDSAFSVMLKQQWEHYNTQQGHTPVLKPTPPKPYVIEKPTTPVDFEIKIAPKPVITPQPSPIIKPASPQPTVKPVPADKPIVKPTSPQPTVKPVPDDKPIEHPVVKPEIATPVVKPEIATPVIPLVPPKKKPNEDKKPIQEKIIDSYGKGNCNIEFYGTKVNIPIPAEMRFSLNNLSENEISKTWDTLSETEYKTVVNSCLNAKKALNLNDWLYVKMVKTVADKWEDNRPNESNLLAMFILLQSGYKVKVANFSGKLALLYASSNTIYAIDFLTLDGDNYYILDDLGGGSLGCTTYRGNFGSNLNQISFILNTPPATAGVKAKEVRRYSGVIDLKMSMNKNLIDMYNDFPLCDYSVYLNTPVSKELRQEVIDPLRQFIAGSNELESAGILLNFVQKGFDYKTDHQQFGRERPLFVDENFYYPYNDCEDRSMIYTMLIRELLGLDVILLEYPNHVATAVHFNTEVKGDYVTFEGKRYTVCDPTCINANVGVTMPQFRKTTPEAKRY